MNTGVTVTHNANAVILVIGTMSHANANGHQRNGPHNRLQTADPSIPGAILTSRNIVVYNYTLGEGREEPGTLPANQRQKVRIVSRVDF